MGWEGILNKGTRLNKGLEVEKRRQLGEWRVILWAGITVQVGKAAVEDEAHISGSPTLW